RSLPPPMLLPLVPPALPPPSPMLQMPFAPSLYKSDAPGDAHFGSTAAPFKPALTLPWGDGAAAMEALPPLATMLHAAPPPQPPPPLYLNAAALGAPFGPPSSPALLPHLPFAPPDYARWPTLYGE